MPLQNVVVVDAFPAGFAIGNPHLKTTDGKVVKDHRFGVERTDMRDDRLILFARPGSGRSTYTYVVRTVTQGTFALPPIAAECMYDSEVASVHGDRDHVRIVANAPGSAPEPIDHQEREREEEK